MSWDVRAAFDATVDDLSETLVREHLRACDTPGPVAGIDEDDLRRGAAPRMVPPRNPRIGELFKEIGLAEKRLSGLDKIYQAMEGNDPRALLESAKNKLYLAQGAHGDGRRAENVALLQDARILLERLLRMEAPRRRHAWDGVSWRGHRAGSASRRPPWTRLTRKPSSSHRTRPGSGRSGTRRGRPDSDRRTDGFGRHRSHPMAIRLVSATWTINAHYRIVFSRSLSEDPASPRV